MLEVHAAERIGAVVTYSSGAAAIVFGLTTSEMAGVVAAVVCILSYLTTHSIASYFKYQELKLLREADKRHAALERERMDATLAAIERNTIMSLAAPDCEGCPYSKSKEDA